MDSSLDKTVIQDDDFVENCFAYIAALCCQLFHNFYAMDNYQDKHIQILTQGLLEKEEFKPYYYYWKGYNIPCYKEYIFILNLTFHIVIEFLTHYEDSCILSVAAVIV